MRRCSRIGLASAAFAILCFAGPRTAHAAPSICDTVPGNLIANCGFEGGVRTDTQGGFTNGNVPNSWTVNTAFDEFSSFNLVTNAPGNVHSGGNALQIADTSAEPAPIISQTFATVNGATYTVSFDYFFGGGTDANSFFDAQIDGSNKFTTTDASAASTYTLESFTFTGTGSDTLSFTADTTPSFYFVDDVEVTGAARTSVPEPASIALFGAGFAALGAMRRRKKAKA